ncbi:glycosyltransferase family 8 protein [Aaosphaeria arxii CBS 175.79]|uniref:Glycosyltransferase family 8 protein n=1 Tax=Aaosphaeria arxii CBS 175.79 TaxID=1450172 RepID=A0A6A5XEJ2_9PLEO|nr:glycosyltransferase family 8 protein [Aaosphaeria arxii CBS 175.79]KAF2011635.1 glycosyltransferase family 8 protein [Aaosphaeria arxii CBS 175.79]
MRRKHSEELPRFVPATRSLATQFRRRHLIYILVGLLFVYWLLPSRQPSQVHDDNRPPPVNWHRYAYSLYATDSATLCHAVLIFDALAKFGSKADRILFYPKQWDTIVSGPRDRDSQLLVMARDVYKVKLEPVDLLTVEGRVKDSWSGTWDKSVTKFMAFSLTYYDRVIALDSDLTLLQSIDELFLLPPTPMAMPRAYWQEKPAPLTSFLMVVKPDLAEFERFKRTITSGGKQAVVEAHRFDMEIANERFEDSAMVLPHRPYGLLTGEFRSMNHSAYLGDPDEVWDAEKIRSEAKLVHFSDWPLPKPWIMWPLEGLAEVQPDCGGSHEGSCPERKIWKHFYEDFRHRRKEICKLLSVPAPDWYKIKDGYHRPNATAATEEGTTHAASIEAQGEVRGESEAKASVEVASHDT